MPDHDSPHENDLGREEATLGRRASLPGVAPRLVKERLEEASNALSLWGVSSDFKLQVTTEIPDLPAFELGEETITDSGSDTLSRNDDRKCRQQERHPPRQTIVPPYTTDRTGLGVFPRGFRAVDPTWRAGDQVDSSNTRPGSGKVQCDTIRNRARTQTVPQSDRVTKYQTYTKNHNTNSTAIQKLR